MQYDPFGWLIATQNRLLDLLTGVVCVALLVFALVVLIFRRH
jgi:hypothetical protein